MPSAALKVSNFHCATNSVVDPDPHLVTRIRKSFMVAYGQVRIKN
jgi:hypothetical protein